MILLAGLAGLPFMFRYGQNYSLIISTLLFAFMPIAIVGGLSNVGGIKAGRVAGYILIAFSIGSLALWECLFWQNHFNPEIRIVDNAQVTNVGRILATLAPIIFFHALINIVATALSMRYFSRQRSGQRS